MGSLAENNLFNLKEWKTNLISKLSQKRLESCLTFFCVKEENFPIKGSLKNLVCTLLLLIDRESTLPLVLVALSR